MVGGSEVVKGVIYELHFLDNTGRVTKAWAFGLDKIIEDNEPQDLRPREAFEP